MKPKNLWSMLILIPLALLLYGGRSINAASLSPGPTPTNAQNPHPEPSSSAIDQADASTKTLPSALPTIQKAEEPHKRSPQIEGGADQYIETQRALVVANGHLVGATIGLVLVGFLQVLALGVQIYLLKRAFRADRPYLLVSRARLDRFLIAVQMINTLPEPAHRAPLSALLMLRNYGKGPAIVEQILAAVTAEDTRPEIGDFFACQEQRIRTEGVGAGENTVLKITGYPSKGEWWQVVDGKERIAVYGRVQYRDVFEHHYSTEFRWEYRNIPVHIGIPPKDAQANFHPRGNIGLGPRSHNRSK